MTPYASFKIGGQDWTAHLVSAAEMKKLDGDATDEGLMRPETQQIFIRRIKNKSRLRDTFLHEICHAFLESTGMQHQLQTGYKGKDYHEWEETLIRIFVPHLATFIDDWARDKNPPTDTTNEI